MKAPAACLSLLVIVVAAPLSAATQAATVYRCPGPPPLYTDQITAQEAKDRNCRTIEGAPVTVMQSARPRGNAALPAPVASGPRPAESRVDPGDQRARDSDARRILEAELQREEQQLDAMRREFNNGEPERRGDEARNYQKYLDRVAEMRAGLLRKESDVAAIRRELQKLPAASAGAPPSPTPTAAR
jgi:hypothetical protein